MVQGDAAADGRERIAREIEVRDRLKHEVRAVIAQGGQRVVLVQGQLVEADARHGLADELACVGAGQQKLREGLAVAGGHAAAAADKVLNEAAAQAVAQGQRLRGQIGKIDDLHAAVAQHAPVVSHSGFHHLFRAQRVTAQFAAVGQPADNR